MRRKTPLATAALMFGLTAAALTPSATAAQSDPRCAQMPVDVLVAGERAADYIFQGRVYDQNQNHGFALFEIERYWKGSSGKELAVRVPKDSAWAEKLSTGTSYMILAKRYGGELWLDPCLQAAAAAKPDALMDRLSRQ